MILPDKSAEIAVIEIALDREIYILSAANIDLSAELPITHIIRACK
jgi:hypothetical protein